MTVWSLEYSTRQYSRWGAIDELASLLWHTKYFDVGTFSLLAPITDNNSRLLVEGNNNQARRKKEVKTADGGDMAQGSADNRTLPKTRTA